VVARNPVQSVSLWLFGGLSESLEVIDSKIGSPSWTRFELGWAHLRWSGAGLLPLQRPLRYCEYMRNITVAVDDETYKRARVAAAERDTSVSALVKAYLKQLASQETEIERLKRQEREIRSQIAAFNAADRLSREDLNSRSQ
jgi:hypothetical protein